MKLPDFLVRDDDGFVHVAEHRIGLHDVIHYYNAGASAEGLLDFFPTLSLATIHKVIAFYLENTADVDAYLNDGEAEIARQRASATRGPDADELRRRLAAKHAAHT